jgi:hypothetical protein
MDEDQRSILIIWGILIFLPRIQVEARIGVVDATCRQLGMTVLEEEEKQILKSTPTEKEEHIVDMITQWEKELKFMEDWL